jgi:flagellar hook-associated protein 2
MTASLGVTASVVTNSDGTSSLKLASGVSGSSGSLTVSSSVVAAGTGVTAGVESKDGYSSLTLASQKAGTSGALTVSSSITATSDTALSASTTSGSSTATSSATLTSVSSTSDVLSGSLVIQVGTGTTQTITIDSSSNTLSTLSKAINKASIGVTASVVYGSSGSYLQLTSGTSGSAGDLTVTSNILDTTDTSATKLSYTNSSDINSLTSMGISVNNDGTISLDVTSLDSVLNSDYSGVLGFFQNANSWGLDFTEILTNAGTSSSSGLLSLSLKSDSSIESKLTSEISRQESVISVQEASLTLELNSANETIQAIPSQLSEIDELYSAITGYNTSS